MANTLTEGQQVGNYTEMLFEGYPVAFRGNKTGRFFEICKRCGGSGHYSFNLMDGTICYGCNGKRVTAETTEADVIRKAQNRAKAAAKRAEKAENAAAEQARVMDEWQAANADLVAALTPYVSPVDEQGYTDFSFRPVNNFLTSMADQAVRGFRPLSAKQVEAAWNALQVQKDRDAAREAQKAAQAAAGHFGKVGEKITAEVEVVAVRFFEGDWNRASSYLVTMRTNEGHVLKTFSSGAFGREAERGQTLTISGTVKAHGDYNGSPETTLLRVKAL